MSSPTRSPPRTWPVLSALGEAWWVGAVLAPAWGRWGDIYGIFWFPAAREGGMGQTFQEHVRHRDFVLATALALVFGAAVSFPAGALVICVLAPLIPYRGNTRLDRTSI